MSDIFREIDEELRRDQFSRIWRRFGGLVIAGALLIVLGTAGYVAWQRWERSTAEEETLRLARVIGTAEAGDAAAAAREIGTFAQDAHGGRAVLARLYEAGLLAETGDRAGAARVYDEVAASDAGQPYRDLATLLAVLHRLEEGDPAELRSRLAPLVGQDSPWRHSARELDALLMLRAGDRAGAAKIFTELSEDPAAPQGVRSRAAELAAVHAEA
jgi:hypothetical protein